MSENSALFTDFYSLTMAQGYWKRNPDDRAVFEMFFRHQPFGGGYAIFAGLGTLLDKLTNAAFSDTDISYLKDLNVFEDGFIDFLKMFRFNGTLWAMDEGTAIFPNEPLIRVEGSLAECQIIEGLILNTINFQSLIATKTCRIWLACGKGKIMEFGLRRAQGYDGALSASRAAFIGGASGTSNTLAAKIFGIPAMGTMAHSWVMSFDSEEEAFDAYAALYPDRTIFLIDTYDTLKSGIKSAINSGKKLAAAGRNFGVRLDSGDIHYLSCEVRRLLDEAGLKKAFITVSNDLEENIIETLYKAGAPVDSWGVGTRMVTGGVDSAFTGVYKLSARLEGNAALTTSPKGEVSCVSVPVMKFSDNPEKTTNPGIKQVWRVRDRDGFTVADVLGLDGQDELKQGQRYCFWHPSADYRHFYHTIEGEASALLKKRLERGALTEKPPALAAIREFAAADLETFDSTHKRLLNPHIYKVSVTENLRSLKLGLIQKHFGDRN
ncbi:MAG: nicotinate phosphoribosyltransferase [Treponema sp.]|jgi:nicotinate phosphoribosyltransferase|nr:nicotinate phosphoribosyltransferase [Treponema sp.]